MGPLTASNFSGVRDSSRFPLVANPKTIREEGTVKYVTPIVSTQTASTEAKSTSRRPFGESRLHTASMRHNIRPWSFSKRRSTSSGRRPFCRLNRAARGRSRGVRETKGTTYIVEAYRLTRPISRISLVFLRLRTQFGSARVDPGNSRRTGATPPFRCPNRARGCGATYICVAPPGRVAPVLSIPGGKANNDTRDGQEGTCERPRHPRGTAGDPQEAGGGEAPRPPRLPLSGLRPSELPERLFPLR